MGLAVPKVPIVRPGTTEGFRRNHNTLTTFVMECLGEGPKEKLPDIPTYSETQNSPKLVDSLL